MQSISPERRFEISSVGEFLETLKELRRHEEWPTTFRGQRSPRPLYPSLTRPDGPATKLDRETVVSVERKLLDEFRRRLPKERQARPDYWEAAVYGRHHRLATRFLDWTELPIVALFFAVMPTGDEAAEGPACVVGTHGKRLFMHELPDVVGPTPWELRGDGPWFFIPDFGVERIMNQRSVLSVWREPSLPFENVTRAVWRFDVEKRHHAGIRRELDTIGITHELLFPGLDGTAQYLTWKAIDEAATLR